MKPDFNLCDICKDEVPKDLTLFLVTGSQHDGVSGQEDIGENVDLCNSCAIKALRFCLSKRNSELPELLWKFVKMNRKP